jgi:hypothetical protein
MRSRRGKENALDEILGRPKVHHAPWVKQLVKQHYIAATTLPQSYTELGWEGKENERKGRTGTFTTERVYQWVRMS